MGPWGVVFLLITSKIMVLAPKMIYFTPGSIKK